MINKLNILAIIPARGGSKGILKKNIKLFNKKPLIYYTINEAKKSKFINKIIVSTDDSEISEISKKFGVDIIQRPKKLASDKSNALLTYRHVIDKLKKHENYIPDIIVILQPTSPLRIVTDIDESIKKYLSKNCEVVVSITKANHPPHWTLNMEKNERLHFYFKNTKSSIPRQDYSDHYYLNGALIVTNIDHLSNCKDLLSKNMVGYIMPEERSIDIDTVFDFKMAEMLMKNLC